VTLPKRALYEVKTLGFAQTQQGNDSPAPPPFKPPTPDSFGGSLAGRQFPNVAFGKAKRVRV